MIASPTRLCLPTKQTASVVGGSNVQRPRASSRLPTLNLLLLWTSINAVPKGDALFTTMYVMLDRRRGVTCPSVIGTTSPQSADRTRVRRQCMCMGLDQLVDLAVCFQHKWVCSYTSKSVQDDFTVP